MRLRLPSGSFRALQLVACTVALVGCSAFSATAPTVDALDAKLHGKVIGGQQPVSGASIQLYAVGLTGDGSAATPLLAQPVLTASDGSFSFSALNCTGSTQVYMTATGGQPGGPAVNPNLALMTALGSCSSLGSNAYIAINELTTVAATSALSPFMSSTTAVGSSSSDAGALANAFTLAAQLVNPATGSTPGVALPSGYSDPVTQVNTLGNILAACVNSTGGVAGDNSACGSLFSLSLNSSGAAPSDTLQAALNIARTPTANLQALFNLAPSNGPFQTQLSAAPASWQIALQPSSAAITRSFLIMPDQGPGVLYNLVNNAQHTIDMTMYELVDTTFSTDLAQACRRGVKVRVILDQNNEMSLNQPAYNQLNSTPNCQAVWANPQFQVTHQKSILVDETTVAILSLNLTSRYYSSTRDYGLIENDPMDIAAVQTTFNTDYNSSSDYSFQPPAGDDLIWSPTTASVSLTGIINNAKSTLLVENEEMSASNIVTALANACKRGVAVQITMTYQSTYATNLTTLKNAGCGVHTYQNVSSQLYIHAKALVADYGLSTATTYMGSINFSNASLSQNRELGLYITDPAITGQLQQTMLADYKNAAAY